jgi:hypothetical protein
MADRLQLVETPELAKNLILDHPLVSAATVIAVPSFALRSGVSN